MDHPKDQPLCLVHWNSRVYIRCIFVHTPFQNLKIPYVVDGFSKSGVYHLRLSSVYPGDFTWVFYTSQMVSFRDFLHGPLATTSSHLAVQRWEGHGGLHGCGGADPVLVQHPVAWGEITPVPPIRRPLSKVVSTHLWNTPLNLYQQAIKGFLS